MSRFLSGAGSPLRPDDASITRRTAVRIQVYRLLSLLAGALILFFGVLYNWEHPQATDPNWIRFGLAALILGLFGASYVSRHVRRHFVSLIWIGLYVTMAWLAGLASVNNFSADYTIGLLVVYAATAVVVGLGARSIVPVVCFLVAGHLFTVVGVLSAPGLRTSPSILISGLSTLALGIGISLWGQFSDRQQLEEQETQLRTIAENVSDGIYRSTPDEGLVFVNHAFAEMFGYDSREAVTRVSSNSLYADPDRRDQLANVLEEKGKFDNFEIDFRRQDGSTFTGLLSGTVVRGADGNVQYYDGAITDITDLKRQRQALEERRRKLEALYSATDRLLRADDRDEVGEVLTGIIQEALSYQGVSVRFVERGWLEPSYVTESTLEFMPERPKFAVDGENVAAEVYRTGETLRVRDTGETDIEDPHDYGDLRSAVVLPLGEHGIFSVTSPDANAIGTFDTHLIEVLGTYATVVLDRLRQERHLRSAKEEAEQARAEAVQASTAKSAFLANMSHEIRTPLTSVIGFAGALNEEIQSLKDRVGEEQLSQLCQFSQLIQQGGERLLKTLDAVLNLSKLEAGEIDLNTEPIDLAEKARQAAEELRPSAQEKGLSLSEEISAEAMWAEADEGALQIVLQNLVSNALKYTEEGGVAVRVYQEGREAILEVEDTGIGMDPAVAESLFEPFRQASEGLGREFEGTGLGLAVTKKAVEQMGGQIGVDTEKGEGSRFVVRLPRTDENLSTSDGPFKTNENGTQSVRR